MSKVNKFQTEIGEGLGQMLEQETVTEWYSEMGKGMYAPRVDVAVGPFAIEAGVHMNQEHSHLLHQHEDFFRQLVGLHLENLQKSTQDTPADDRKFLIEEKMNSLFVTNQNARCFMAIEIENEVSRKHLMGGAVNCSVLAKVGIAVGFSDKKHHCFLNLYRYFDYLRQVEKPTFNTANLLIISKDQLIDALAG